MKIGRNDPCSCGSGKKHKKCCLVLQQNRGIASLPPPESMIFNPMRAEKFTIRIGCPGKQYKICKLMFAEDGSIYIALPYFRNSEGLASLCTIPHSEAKTISLQERGKVTSHLIKFAHHWADGEAHFSQDGKVKTEIRRKAEPLNTMMGHFATMQMQGLSGFKYHEHESTRSEIDSGDQILTLTDEKITDNKAYKLIFHYYNFNDLAPILRGPIVGPVVEQHHKDGSTQPAWLLAPPLSSQFRDRVIELRWEEIKPMSPDSTPLMMFLGGFNKVLATDDRPIEFLSLMYPCSDFEGLKEKIGCIDLDRSASQKIS